MKKRLLLCLLPAILALSSCTSLRATAATVTPNGGLDNIVEDTEAHDEIFGESGSLGQSIGVRKLAIPVNPDHDDSIPAIGIQSKVDDKGDENALNDTVSIRFVAAVKLADYASASVVWTRTMYNSDGSVVTGKEEDDYPSVKAYQSIAAENANESDPDPDVLTIDDFNQAPRNTAYTHFVVYTMSNIPLFLYNECFLNAYVTVNNSVSSKELAVRVDRNIVLSFDKNQTGFFLVDDENNVVQVNEEIKGSNLAAFTTNLKCDGYFSIAEKDDSFFKVYDPSVELEGDSTYFIGRDSAQRTEVYVGASYEIYLNGSNELSVVASGNYVRYINLDITEVAWWGEDRKAALWSWGGSEDARWIELEEVVLHEWWRTVIPIDPTEFNQFCVVDVKKGYDPGWGEAVNNQTLNTSTLSTSDKNDTIKIKDYRELNEGREKYQLYGWQSSYVVLI